MDLLIASTAMYMNLSLVTNNKAHFSRIKDLVLENWEEKDALLPLQRDNAIGTV